MKTGYSKTTEAIICSFYKVYNALGSGFLEKVYENSLSIELKNCGFKIRQQHPVQVLYQNEAVGEFFCDVLVENEVILEIKALNKLLPIHEAQLLNYLKATGIKTGLLLNFGVVPEVRRKVY